MIAKKAIIFHQICSIFTFLFLLSFCSPPLNLTDIGWYSEKNWISWLKSNVFFSKVFHYMIIISNFLTFYFVFKINSLNKIIEFFPFSILFCYLQQKFYEFSRFFFPEKKAKDRIIRKMFLDTFTNTHMVFSNDQKDVLSTTLIHQ